MSEREAPATDPRWPVAWTNRLQDLAGRLSAAADPASMARETIAQGQAALEADAGVVCLLSAEAGVVEAAHVSGYPEVDRWLRFPLSANLPATEAIRNRETVLVRSREEMRARYPDAAMGPGMLVFRSWAAVPLVVDGVCIGALGLSFATARAFEAPEVAFIRVVADHCAQALHRAQLAERERRSTERLRVLAKASRVLAAASLDVDSVLEALSAVLLDHVGPSCSIGLATPDGEWLEFPTIRDKSPDRERALRQSSATVRVRRGEGLTGRVLASGRSLLLPSIAPDELAAQAAPAVAQQIETLRVRSAQVVPLKTGGRTLGTIAAARYDAGDPFTLDDQALLEDLADRAALAIENARLHEAERQARARAEDADRRKDEFLATLGHELRNPLAPIWMAIEILRQHPAQGEREVWVRDVIARQVAQLSRLVDDLLDVSRINLGKIQLRLEVLDLGAIALQALEASRPLLSERNHQVSVDLPTAALLVRGDAVRLTQVVSNLLNNAAKYTDPQGRVRLRVESRQGEAVVTVSDSGIGIPAEMLERVFDLFAQGQGAHERSKGGLGIGLTLVKSLVEMHGGYVRASSAGQGHGSEFAIGFPLLDAASAGDGSGAPAPGSPCRSRRVMIVDDNVDAAEALRVLLELRGHAVAVAHDGAAALEILARTEPDVALLDINLPGIDGLEIARRIRSRGGARRPLLVAITGLGRDDDRRRSVDAGFDHHLVKPIDPASLTALLAD